MAASHKMSQLAAVTLVSDGVIHNHMAKETSALRSESASEVTWQALVSDFAKLNGSVPAPQYAKELPPPALQFGRVSLDGRFMAKLTAETGLRILTEEEIELVRSVDTKSREIDAARDFWIRARDGHAVHQMLETQAAERVVRDGVGGLAASLPSRQEFSESARTKIRILNAAEAAVQRPLLALARLAAERIQTAAKKVLERVEAQEREEAVKWGVAYQPGGLVEALRVAANIPAGFVPAEGVTLAIHPRAIPLLAWCLAPAAN